MTATIIPGPPRADRQVPLAEASPAFAEPPAATASAPPRRRLSLRRTALVATVAVVVLSIAGAAAWQYLTVWRYEVSTDDATVQADVVTIAPQVGGPIAEVLVGDNEPVRAGQVLARIDERPYAAALAQARGDVAAAAANVADVEAQLIEQQSLIAEAQATIKVDAAAQAYAVQNNARFGTLARDGYGSVQDAQQAASQASGLQASVVKDEAAADAAEKQVAILQAKLEEAKGLLAHTQAAERTAELNLGYTTITTPTDGVVGERTLRVGQIVAPGTQLMAIVPLDRTYVVGNFKETELTDVRAGQSVRIAVDTFPSITVHGVVDSIAPASGEEFALLPPDNATGNFTKIVQRIPVKIRLDPANPLAGLLRPGMSVTPTIDVSPGAAPAGPVVDGGRLHKADRLPLRAAPILVAEGGRP